MSVTNTLTASGFVVVTDFNISKNEEFGDAIDTMIRKARMTIVLWTKAASKSPWVRQEARLARDLSRAAGHPNHYLGVMVESVDLLLPSDLRGLQMIDAQLSGLTDAKLDEVTALRDLYIHSNPHPNGEKDELVIAGDGSSWSRVHQEHHEGLRQISLKYFYRNRRKQPSLGESDRKRIIRSCSSGFPSLECKQA